MTVAGKGGAPFGPRSPGVVNGLAMVCRLLAQGLPVYDRKKGRGIFSDAARESGISPQQLHAAWRRYVAAGLIDPDKIVTAPR